MTYRGNMNLKHAARQRAAGFANTRNFRDLGLPNLLKRQSMKSNFAPGAVKGCRKWQRLAKELPKMEAALTKWEDENPELYRSLPWYEDREAFRALKAAGQVTWPTWWELAGAVSQCAWYSVPLAKELAR